MAFNLQSRLEAFRGPRKYAAAFLLGALSVFALPPLGLFFILLVTVPGFIWLARHGKTKRETFLVGWAFGAGYFIFGLYWVSFALFVDIEQFGWVLPFSAILGPAALALYYGLIPLLAWRYRRNETAYALIFVAAWALIEWVRGHAFTGFPWNFAGHAWNLVPALMQVNAVIGIYGLTLLTLLWAAVPAMNKKYVPLALISFLFIAGLGTSRMLTHPTQESGSTVRVLQPNIPQSLKWNRDDMWRNFRHNLELTATPAKNPVTFVVWPETALMADLGNNPDLAQDIAASMPKGSLALIGTLRIGEKDYYNSVSVLDKRGRIVDNYDKHHLVPFGEYIPYRKYLNLTPIAAGISGIGDFTRGAGVRTLSLGTLPHPSPLICYEGIFPGEVARRDDRPDWLLNVTNDAWYGKTAGPHQHFENVRIRAIEEGLPLVRSANTGISAVVDPLGRIIGIAPLQKTKVIDTILPKPLPPTLYSRFGDTLFFLMLVLLLIGAESHRKVD